MIAKEINVRRITKDSKTIQPEPGGSIILLWLPEWSVVQVLGVDALARNLTLLFPPFFLSFLIAVGLPFQRVVVGFRQVVGRSAPASKQGRKEKKEILYVRAEHHKEQKREKATARQLLREEISMPEASSDL